MRKTDVYKIEILNVKFQNKRPSKKVMSRDSVLKNKMWRTVEKCREMTE